MRKISLAKMSVAELLARYIAISVEQGRLLDLYQTAKFNRLFDRIVELNVELKSRPGDQRRALITLHTYPDMQTRMNAAYATIAVAPDAARRVFESIAEANWYPQTANARGIIDLLDKGTWKPMRGLD